MARCGCTSSTCSCVVADGTNTTVTGDGSQATPYMVNVSNEAIQDAVGAGLGCGLEYDDAANQLRVNLSAQGGNTLQCLPDGLFSTPGAVAIGCGLTTDGGGNIVVNTAGDFGSLTRRNCNDTADAAGTTPLAGPDTAGQLVYCDTAGDLRVTPEKFTEVAVSQLNEAHVPAITALPFTTTPIQIGFTNPSDQYCMCGYVQFAAIPAISGSPGTVVEIGYDVDPGSGVFTTTANQTMDNRGKTATAGLNNRVPLLLNICLDPGETKIIRFQVRYQRSPSDNGAAVTITGTAREIRAVGTNL